MRVIFVVSLALAAVFAQGGASMAAQAPAKTSWGTPTLTDWNGVWSGYRGPLVKATSIYNLPPPVPSPKYAPYMQAAQAAIAKGMEVTHEARCLPLGIPTLWSMIYPGEMFISPAKITILFENIGFVNIWLDGRKHSDYIEPSYTGESIGRWEGDTLVVETIGITTRTVLSGGARHSSKLRVIARLREVQPGLIENRVRIEDPVAFKGPVDYVIAYKKTPEEVLKEYYCEKSSETGIAATSTFDAFEALGEPTEEE